MAPIDCLSPFPASDSATLRIVTLTSAGLSLFGSAVILLSYILLPRLRTFPFRLVCFLCTADFFASASYFVGLGDLRTSLVCTGAFSCYLEAAMTQYFDVATFCWMACIAFNVYQVLVKGSGRAVESFERRYHFFAWGLPLLLLLAAASTRSLGDAGLWCWIKPSFPITQFICYYFILLSVFIFNSFMFTLVVIHIRQDASAAISQNAITTRLISYLAVFFIIRCWDVFDRLNIAATGDINFGLAALHSFFSPLQGFCNAIVYGFTRNFIEEWKDFLRKYWSACLGHARVSDIIGGTSRHDLLAENPGHHLDNQSSNNREIIVGFEGTQMLENTLEELPPVKW
jgi:hypothetical protein